MLQGEFDQAWRECGSGRAKRALERLQAVAEQIDERVDVWSAFRCQWLMGWVLFRCGNVEEAFGYAQKAKLLAVQLDSSVQAKAAGLYGMTVWSLGLNDECYTEATHAVSLAEESGDLWALAFSLHVLSLSIWMGGDAVAAETVSKRATDIARQIGDTHLTSWLLINLSCIFAQLAEDRNGVDDQSGFEQAATASFEANALGAANGDSWAQRLALSNGAEFLAYLGRYSEAHGLLEAWMRVEGDEVARHTVYYLSARTFVLLRENRLEEARNYCEQALALAEGGDSKDQMHVIVKLLSEVHEALGDYETALLHFKRYHTLQRQFEGERVKLRARVAAVFYEAEKLRQLAEQSEREATTDPLTGIANRRRLDRVFSGFSESGRHDFAVAMIDLDYFKSINDQYSHAVGDAVIKAFAHLLTSMCRQDSDLVARIGGEEFVLLIGGGHAEVAVALCDRVQEATRTYDWDRIAPGLTVTASVGLALGDEASEPKGLLALADARLYRAKADGRDRVVSAGAGGGKA